MGKRKRPAADASAQPFAAKVSKQTTSADSKFANATTAATASPPITLQVVTGSYERTLHGFIARLPSSSSLQGIVRAAKSPPAPSFADTFLFNAHSSSLRCLALSPRPASSSRILLATGSSDERINLYSLSTLPPPTTSATKNPSSAPLPASLPSANPTAENPSNRPLGSLHHHTRPITALLFPSRTKLLSASDDLTIGITRVRDWTLLSSARAPAPRPHGRPSGDTSTATSTPRGVAAVAAHPSGRLLLSVGRGERCLRLWNLVTGRRAGVLNFARDVLARLGEFRPSLSGASSGGGVPVGPGTGEAHAVEWAPDGELFAVAFERGCALYGIDCTVRAVVLPHTRVGRQTKLHRMRFLPEDVSGRGSVLAVSTEDGRVVFYAAESTSPTAAEPEGDANGAVDGETAGNKKAAEIPELHPIGEILPASAGSDARPSRVKDFELLACPGLSGSYFVVTGTSDGAVSIHLLRGEELSQVPASSSAPPSESVGGKDSAVNGEGVEESAGVGVLLGTYETGSRITCLVGFVMDAVGGEAPVNGEAEAVGELNGKEDDGQEDEDDDRDAEQDLDEGSKEGLNEQEEHEEWGGIDDE